ncbi:MAG: WD40 repeat domain-containing protein [Gemmataceae bacterium]|nr:WD40 repeat domain-containing protein [Gemmataceae bacterium]MDW8266094.1 WD40 repeat domain-containing protein [Gemmataceae bacterium]
MATLRLVSAGTGPADQAGEVLGCCYAPEGAFVLSAGWDGQLRLWETARAAHVTALRVSSKPVSACAISPDGGSWLAGTLDGFLSRWNALTHEQTLLFLAHPRPVSAILYGGNEHTLITASWDGNLIVWDLTRERHGRTLAGHRDIVAGCRLTPDGQTIVSWSHDGTLRTWDMARLRPMRVFAGHSDRVTAAAISCDGRWVVSGSRDAQLRLWDLQTGAEHASTTLAGEVRSLLCLLDGETVVAVDFSGRLTLHRLADLEMVGELVTYLPTQCAALAPSGGQIALGCADGRVRFVAVDGFDSKPLQVTARPTERPSSSMLRRLFGRRKLTPAFECICPACRESVELIDARTGQAQPCPKCRRPLRVSAIARLASPWPSTPHR